MLMHDLRGIVDVLDGVLGLAFFDDVGGGNALRGSQLCHSVGFDQVIVRRPASHDDVWGNAGFVFAHTFEDSFALLRRWSTVKLGRSAQHDNGVEVRCGGVVGGKSEVVAVDDEAEGKDQQKENEEEPGQKSHAVRVAEASRRARFNTS